MNTILESNRANSCKTFDPVNQNFYFSYRGLQWHSSTKVESENIGENLRDIKIFKTSERKNNFEVKTFSCKTSVNGITQT